MELETLLSLFRSVHYCIVVQPEKIHFMDSAICFEDQFQYDTLICAEIFQEFCFIQDFFFQHFVYVSDTNTPPYKLLISLNTIIWFVIPVVSL